MSDGKSEGTLFIGTFIALAIAAFFYKHIEKLRAELRECCQKGDGVATAPPNPNDSEPPKSETMTVEEYLQTI